MPLPRTFIDTNVLFPFSVMDLMLALTEDGIHTVLWSDPLLNEWERVIVRSGRRSGEAASAITSAIRQHFPDGYVPTADFAHLIDRMPGDDPDDRIHMAAAIGGAATHLVTYNLTDFPTAALARCGVTVIDPDAYLLMLLAESCEEVLATVDRLAAEKRRPPMTTDDLLGRLEKAGVSQFAARARMFV